MPASASQTGVVQLLQHIAADSQCIQRKTQHWAQLHMSSTQVPVAINTLQLRPRLTYATCLHLTAKTHTLCMLPRLYDSVTTPRTMQTSIRTHSKGCSRMIELKGICYRIENVISIEVHIFCEWHSLKQNSGILLKAGK